MDKIYEVIENDSLENSISYFFTKTDKEMKDFLKGGILHNISNGVVNFKYIIFLEELYYQYNNVDAICMLEHIFSIWYPPYIKESYDIACYYKKKMIKNNVKRMENIEELLKMNNPIYREYFDNKYISELCHYVIENIEYSNEVKEIAKSILNGVKKDVEWWNFNLI